MLNYLPENNGYTTVEYLEGNFYIRQMALPATGIQIEYWSLSSSKPLIDWSSDLNKIIWIGYLLNDESRFNYDGYYYSSNEYFPPEANSFKLMPSAYVVNGFIQTGGSLASDQLGIAMLDVLQSQQNSEGYFTSQPASLWLKENYGLNGGFYDTRFCTDLAHNYLTAYQKFGIEAFYQTANKYGQFFLKHAQNHHFSLTSNANDWLVEDYWHPESSVSFHASLNHQLKEILFLYDLAITSRETVYSDLADQMLNGLKHTASLWILPDNNLNYALKADGSSIGSDYPYLTYNDIFSLQSMLLQIKGEKDPDLQKLAEAKKQWMNVNHVTGYKSEQNFFTAVPSQMQIFIDGQEQSYITYEINGYTYFRLRDLAQALSSSAKPFDVGWEQQVIKIIPNQSYSGQTAPENISLDITTGYVKATKILFDQEEKYLTTYNINNYTYFKLRNIAKMLDIGIDWQGDQICLDTHSNYTSEF
ncbi:MAG: hypothetical protein MJ157_00595 [Clostridia bacterium]|nr:hypothetical protein [Clostridia bacterium]